MDERLVPGTVQADPAGGAEDTVYRCQATEIRRAGGRLRGWHLNQYPKDVRNWGLWKIVRAIPPFGFNKFQRMTRRRFPQVVLFHNGEDYPFIAVETAVGRRRRRSICSRGNWSASRLRMKFARRLRAVHPRIVA